MKIYEPSLRKVIREEVKNIFENVPNPKFRTRVDITDKFGGDEEKYLAFNDPFTKLVGRPVTADDHMVLAQHIKQYRKEHPEKDVNDLRALPLEDFIKWMRMSDHPTTLSTADWYEKNLYER